MNETQETQETQTEEQKAEDKTAEASEKNNNDRPQPEKTNIVEQASSLAERLEKANEETRKLIKRQEELEAIRTLSGKTEGAEQQKQEEEMSPAEYKKQIEAGNVPELKKKA